MQFLSHIVYLNTTKDFNGEVLGPMEAYLFSRKIVGKTGIFVRLADTHVIRKFPPLSKQRLFSSSESIIKTHGRFPLIMIGTLS